MPQCEDLLLRSSQKRLVDLMLKRANEPENRAQIEQKIWELFGETWTIVFTDLSGFSRHSARFGILHFLQIIFESERIFAPIIEEHGGFIVKREGDSMMLLFRNSASALQCAIDMQHSTFSYNEGRADEEKILLCVGISVGDVLKTADDIFGEAVNAASKLGEDIAQAHEILVTDAILLDVDESFRKQLHPIEFVPPGATGAYRLAYPARPSEP